MMRSLPVWQNPVWHLKDPVQMSRSEMESSLAPTLLYAFETWTVYQRHAKKLNHFYLSCLRKPLKIKWLEKIPGTEVLKKAGMQSMHTVLKLVHLRWTGHVIRMPDERLPKKVWRGNYKRESALKVARRSATKTPSKPLKTCLRFLCLDLNPIIESFTPHVYVHIRKWRAGCH